MVWHLGAILMGLSHKMCTSQPAFIPHLLEFKVRFFSLNLELKYVRLCYIWFSLLNIVAKALSSSTFDTHIQNSFLQKLKFLRQKTRYTGCVSESSYFATQFFLVQ
jgi:hypothetical protein